MRSSTDKYTIDATMPAATIHSSPLMIRTVPTPSFDGPVEVVDHLFVRHDSQTVGTDATSPRTAKPETSGWPPRYRAWTSGSVANTVGPPK